MAYKNTVAPSLYAAFSFTHESEEHTLVQQPVLEQSSG